MVTQHQLGILAFMEVISFLRCIGIGGPFLLRYLTKLPWRTSGRCSRGLLLREPRNGLTNTRGEGDKEVLAKKVEQMKENMRFYMVMRVGAQRLNVSADVLASHVAQSFKSLVSERALPTDMITQVVVLAQSALWKHRMVRDVPRAPPSPRLSNPGNMMGDHVRGLSLGIWMASTEETTGPNADDTNVDTPAAIESQIFMHLISLHRVLFEVGAAQLVTPPPSDASENDLAPRITATFRRMLPALGWPASGWWETWYCPLFHSLHGVVHCTCKVVSFRKTTKAGSPLDEDVDLRGFLPLRGKMIGDDIGNGRGQTAPSSVRGVPGLERMRPQVRGGVHPNEEHLMRIWDLLADAKALAKVKDFPVRMEGAEFLLDDARFVIGTKSTSPIAPTPTAASPPPSPAFSPKLLDTRGQPHPYPLRQPREQRRVTQSMVVSDQEQEDDAGTDACRTDDDPVRDAFREVLDNRASSGSELDEEEDEDQIVWNPRPITSPPKTVIPTAPTLPEMVTADAMTVKPTEPPKEPTVMATPSLNSAALPFPPNRVIASSKPKSPSAAAGTTAQDLLNSVMSLGGSRNGTAGGFGASPGLGLSSTSGAECGSISAILVWSWAAEFAAFKLVYFVGSGSPSDYSFSPKNSRVESGHWRVVQFAAPVRATSDPVVKPLWLSTSRATDYVSPDPSAWLVWVLSSTVGAFSSDSFASKQCNQSTMRPSTMAASSLSGGSGLSYHPTAGPKFTDPAIVSMASSTLGPPPPSVRLASLHLRCFRVVTCPHSGRIFNKDLTPAGQCHSVHGVTLYDLKRCTALPRIDDSQLAVPIFSSLAMIDRYASRLKWPQDNQATIDHLDFLVRGLILKFGRDWHSGIPPAMRRNPALPQRRAANEWIKRRTVPRRKNNTYKTRRLSLRPSFRQPSNDQPPHIQPASVALIRHNGSEAYYEVQYNHQSLQKNHRHQKSTDTTQRQATDIHQRCRSQPRERVKGGFHAFVLSAIGRRARETVVDGFGRKLVGQLRVDVDLEASDKPERSRLLWPACEREWRAGAKNGESE
ncbi:hypothetical protein EDD16DRAFT_1731534 [Pisolithus croceorrhizus]|nr:hypothetical protein EDD16DRAFT_1731534 [Pisolithus croceorrhizus]